MKTKRLRTLLDNVWVEYVVRINGVDRYCDCIDCGVEIDADDVLAPLCKPCYIKRYGQPKSAEPSR